MENFKELILLLVFPKYCIVVIPGALPSRFPETAGPVPEWDRIIWEQFEVDVIKILENKLFPFCVLSC